MKEIRLRIIIDESGKIGTAYKFIGYDKDNLNHQLEILGIFQNLVNTQNERIKTKATLEK